VDIFHDAIKRASRRRSARRSYRHYSAQKVALYDNLAVTTAAPMRAELLVRLAEVNTGLSILHHAAYGAEVIPGEAGRDAAVSLASAAHLLRLVAATERMLIAPLSIRADFEELLEQQQVPPAEARLWRDLAHTVDPAERTDAITYLADLAAERVGEHAAQALYDLTATRRSAITSAGRTRWAIVAFIVAVAAAIVAPLVPGLNGPTAWAAVMFGGFALIAVLAWCAWRPRPAAHQAVQRGEEEVMPGS
jgi:hypothetical protein